MLATQEYAKKDAEAMQPVRKIVVKETQMMKKVTAIATVHPTAVELKNVVHNVPLLEMENAFQAN